MDVTDIQKNHTLTILSRHTNEVVLAAYLLLSFLLSETGNTFILITLYKRPQKSTAGETLALVTLASVLVGLFVLLPPCITLLNNQWLQNTDVCALQGFLRNFIWTMLAFTLLSASFNSYSSNALSVYRNNCRKIIVGLILLAGVCVSFAYKSTEQYGYLPGQFSCGVLSSNSSVLYTVLTFITPCSFTLCLNIVILLKTVGRNRRVVPAGMIPGLPHNSTNIRRTDENKKQTTKALAFVQMSLTTSAMLSTVFRFIGAVSISEHEICMNISLVLLGASCMIHPFTVFVLSKPMREAFLDLFVQSSINDTSLVFRTTASTFQGRRMSQDTYNVPDFLLSSSDLNINLTFPSNVDLNSAGTADILRRVSATLSVDRMANDNIFVRVRRSLPYGTCSISSCNEEFNMSNRSLCLENYDDDNRDSVLISIGTSCDKRYRSISSCADQANLHLPSESPVKTESGKLSGAFDEPISRPCHSRRRKTMPSLLNVMPSQTPRRKLVYRL